MAENVLPVEVTEAVAALIRQVCNAENDYTFITHEEITSRRYKISIKLHDVSAELGSKRTVLTIVRQD